MSGVWFGDTDWTCYIPVFTHGLAHEANVIYIGNTFMKEHYTVFDMSPLEDPAMNYL